MFNAFKAQQLRQTTQQQSKQYNKVSQWRTRYKTEVRPNLVDRYHRRINGFAKKMQDEPFKVNNDKGRDQLLEQMAKRKFDETLNITKTRWRLRSKQDWSSVAVEVGRSSAVKKWFEGASSKVRGSRFGGFGSMRSLEGDQKYCKIRVQYRSRDKQKQINPPMKYSSPILPNLPSPRNSRSHQNKTQLIAHRLALNQSTQSDPQAYQNISLSYGQFDQSVHHHSMKKSQKQRQKTQKQLLQQQEMKALVQNKLYFKSLIDMERSVRTAKERNGLKEILVKCGIYKPVAGKIYREEEVDRFLEMMKTRQ